MKLSVLALAGTTLFTIGTTAFADDNRALTGAAGGAVTGAIVGGPVGAQWAERPEPWSVALQQGNPDLLS